MAFWMRWAPLLFAATACPAHVISPTAAGQFLKKTSSLCNEKPVTNTYRIDSTTSFCHTLIRGQPYPQTSPTLARRPQLLQGLSILNTHLLVHCRFVVVILVHLLNVHMGLLHLNRLIVHVATTTALVQHHVLLLLVVHCCSRLCLHLLCGHDCVQHCDRVGVQVLTHLALLCVRRRGV